MGATASIATVGSAHGREFIPHEMPVARPAMATAAKDPYLVDKIALLQFLIFTVSCKNIL